MYPYLSCEQLESRAISAGKLSHNGLGNKRFALGLGYLALFDQCRHTNPYIHLTRAYQTDSSSNPFYLYLFSLRVYSSPFVHANSSPSVFIPVFNLLRVYYFPCVFLSMCTPFRVYSSCCVLFSVCTPFLVYSSPYVLLSVCTSLAQPFLGFCGRNKCLVWSSVD